MAEQDWVPTEITRPCLEGLVRQGFMTPAEFAKCGVPKDLSSPNPSGVGGYVVVFKAFYERGFGVPSHRFLRSLLEYYGLELNHLTPAGILQIAAFVTLCEAYLGIEPHFDLWRYFFTIRGSEKKELAVVGGAVIRLRTKTDMDSYLPSQAADSMKGWRKHWFLMRNDDSALPVFTGRRPIPKHTWPYGPPAKDQGRLAPVRTEVQKLRAAGLTVEHLLQTFFSRRVQPLRARHHLMSEYPGPADPDRPSVEELDEGEVVARIRLALFRTSDPDIGPGPEPLRLGVANNTVSHSRFRVFAFSFASIVPSRLLRSCVPRG